LGVVIFGALYLGAGVESRKAIPSDVQKNTEGAKMPLYNLKEISKYKTPYVGDNGKVSAIVNNLPVPNGYFVQQYISMITDKTPYNLNVYYEPKEEAFGEWQILSGDKVTFSNMSKNALVLFSMIDNLDGVIFAFRGTGSEGKLDASKYNYTYSFEREPFEKKYGKLSVIGGKLDLLQEALTADLNTVGMDIQTPTNEEIERYLEKIMSSPRTSSSPNDYIKAHKNEYQSIIKMGDVALNYLLAQFKNTSNNSDLKGYIMMGLCKELLGERNNVKDEKLSPKEWFSKLAPYAEIKLSDAKTKGSNLIEQLVYDTAVKKYSVANNGFTVVAPTIFGSYEEGNKLKVFVTVFSSSYSLYDKTLSEVSGSVVPAAITFTKNAEGGYTLDEYLESMDGSYWLPSIKKYCIMPVSHKQIKGLSNKILKDYASNVNRSELLMKNLIEHLKSNNKTGIVLKRRTGELVPLT